MEKKVRLQYLHNKETFSHRGVIFTCEDGAVKLYHWPNCGMGAKTAELFANWLEKRAWDIKLNREPKTKPAQEKSDE